MCGVFRPAEALQKACQASIPGRVLAAPLFHPCNRLGDGRRACAAKMPGNPAHRFIARQTRQVNRCQACLVSVTSAVQQVRRVHIERLADGRNDVVEGGTSGELPFGRHALEPRGR